MKPMGDLWSRLKEIAERGKALSLSPEGIAAREAWEREEARRKAVEQAEWEQECWKKRGVPRRMWEDIRRPRYTSALKRVQEFMAHPKQWVLFLSGVVGTGKTYAAAWAVANTPGGIFVKAGKLQGNGPFDRDHRHLVEQARLLVVDDLASEILDSKQFFKGYLFQLLDHRYDAATKTIITTNVSRDAFRQEYGQGGGQRLLDRIRDQGAYFHCDEEKSMRGEASAEIQAAQDLVNALEES